MRRFFFSNFDATVSTKGSTDNLSSFVQISQGETPILGSSYVPLKQLAGGSSLILPSSIYHHWCRVLRAKIGDEGVFFDGLGGEVTVKLEKIDKKEAFAVIQSYNSVDRTAAHYTNIALVMSRGDKMDYAIQKATELGVTSIQLLTSQHSEVKLKHNQISKKLTHWQNVAMSACEQCGLNRPPLILTPISIENYVNGNCGKASKLTENLLNDVFYQDHLNSQPVKLVLAAPSQTTAFKSIKTNDTDDFNNKLDLNNRSIDFNLDKHTLTNDKNIIDEVSITRFDILIGSEGGLSTLEYKQCLNNDFKPWNLGERILRTETAPIVALTLINLA